MTLQPGLTTADLRTALASVGPFWRCRRAFYVLLFCLIAFLQSGLLLAVEGPCKVADTLKSDGHFDDAISRYKSILKDKKLRNAGVEVSCATKGSKEAEEALLIEKKLLELCQNASAQLKAGMASEAERLYKKLVEEKAPTDKVITCAKRGFFEIAKRHVKRGDDRREENDLKAAETSYEAATKASNDYMEAYDKLKKVRHEMNRRYLKALTDLGYEDEAETKLKDFLKADPTFDQDAKDFAFISRPHVPFWKELRATPLQSLHLPKWPPFTWLPSWKEMHWLPATLREMPIIEVLILVILIGLMGHKFWWGRPTLDIKDFSTARGPETATGTEPDKTKSEAAAFAAELEHRMIDFSGVSRTNRQVLMVSAPIQPITVDLSTNIPALKGWDVLTKGLQKLIPYMISRRSLVVNGTINWNWQKTPSPNITGVTVQPECGAVPCTCVQPSISNITEVTIQLECGNRIIAKHTLRASDFKFDAENTNDDLIDCAAIWLLFQLQTNPVQLNYRAITFLRKLVRQPRKILGTADWEAYAWFFLGDKQYQGNGPEKVKAAKAAYLKALSLDPTFLACKVNLAGVYNRLADYDDATNKQSLKEEALRQLHAVSLCYWPLWWRWIGVADPSPYTGLFRKAAINFDLAGLSASEEKRQEYTDEALNVTGDLVKWIRRTQSGRYFFDRELMRYLNWRRPIAECMELGLTVASLPLSEAIPTGIENNLERVAEILKERVDFYSLYNLACTYALFAAREVAPTKSDHYRLSMMNFLERSLELSASMESLGAGLGGTCAKGAQRAKNDPAFKHFWGDQRFLGIVTKYLPATSTNESQQTE